MLLSDVPLSEDARRDVFELIRLGRAGEARVVEVVLDAGQAPISGAIYARACEGMVSAAGRAAAARGAGRDARGQPGGHARAAHRHERRRVWRVAP